MTRSTRRTTKETAGELNQKAEDWSNKVDPLEIAYARLEGLEDNLYECAHKHEHIFDEEEFFVCLFVATDNVLVNVRRHKYAAFLFMPKPRPGQACFLYNKKKQNFLYLWSLPQAHVMATLSSMSYVDEKWQSTKAWCDAFYNGTFWDAVRKKHNITHLSEEEYLDVHRDKLTQAIGDKVEPDLADTGGIPEVVMKEVKQS